MDNYRMYTARVYEEIKRNERWSDNKRLVIILLVRPQDDKGRAIIDNFSYMHFNTGSLCNVYAVGFLDNVNRETKASFQRITMVNGAAWYYNDQAFYELKNYLEQILDWQYHGESTALILQNDLEGRRSLDFRGSVSIDLEYAIRQGFSFNRFMEELMHNVKTELISGNGVLKNQCNLDVEGMTKDAFMNSLPIDFTEKELLYSRCIQRITPRWR